MEPHAILVVHEFQGQGKSISQYRFFDERYVFGSRQSCGFRGCSTPAPVGQVVIFFAGPLGAAEGNYG